MRLPALLALLGVLCACTSLPDINDSVTPEAEAADFPAIAPLDTLLAEVDAAESDEAAERAALDARRQALDARAAGLRGDVISDSDRARLTGALP